MELEIGRDFSTWIEDRIDMFQLIGGKDYKLDSPDLGNQVSHGGDPPGASAIVDSDTVGFELLAPIGQQNTQVPIDARALHSEIGVGRDFSNWIKDRIAKFQYIEG